MTQQRIYSTGSKIPTTNVHHDHDALEASWSWWHITASVGIGTGFLSGLLGLVLTVVSSSVGNEIAASHIGRIGTALIGAFLPLMVLGVHSLDKIDDAATAKRIEYCKQHGLSDGQCK